MRNFEDVVIFVTDMEQAIEKLDAVDKKLLAMNVLEEYTVPEVARLPGMHAENGGAFPAGSTRSALTDPAAWRCAREGGS
jgi:hypothetical protein